MSGNHCLDFARKSYESLCTKMMARELARTFVITSLRVLWVSCLSNSVAAELLEECRRLCSVTTCASNRALAALSKIQPSAVIFDFQEPAAPDLQLLQSIKRLYPSVPILMFTETHSEELAVWAFRARVWNYMVKPVPLRELKTNLQQLARLSEQREPTARTIERPATMIPPADDQVRGHSEAAIMQRIVESIRRDHATRLSIAQLARTCGMSRFSFSRLFHQSFGCSCRDYVMRLRLETACKMLAERNASVTRVAIAAGFTDASYFARIFRRHMHQSPMEYAQVHAASRRRATLTRNLPAPAAPDRRTRTQAST
jgi:YesN/AraC family two-component response regulator